MPAENVLNFVQGSWKMRQENVSGDGVGGELPAHPEWAAVSSGSHAAHGAALLEGIRSHGSFCWQR